MCLQRSILQHLQLLLEETRSVYVTHECCLVGRVGVKIPALGHFGSSLVPETFDKSDLSLWSWTQAHGLGDPYWFSIGIIRDLLPGGGHSPFGVGGHLDLSTWLLGRPHKLHRPNCAAKWCCHQYPQWILLRQKGTA